MNSEAEAPERFRFFLLGPTLQTERGASVPTLQSMEFPKPSDWQDFERIVKCYCELKWPSQTVKPNGRNGQKQNGVDLYVKCKDGSYLGIQCKLSLSDSLPVKTIEREVEKAVQFKPALAHYYIATTANRHARTQEQVNIFNQHRMANGLFDVDILFWEDIIELIKNDRKVLNNLYPELLPSPRSENNLNIHIEHNAGAVVGHLHIHKESKTRKKAARRYLEGTVGSDPYQLGYIRHLIERYKEFKSMEYPNKKMMNYAILYKSIERDQGFKWDEMPVEKFADFCSFLQNKIDNTKFGRTNKAKGNKNYSSYEAYLTKHLDQTE